MKKSTISLILFMCFTWCTNHILGQSISVNVDSYKQEFIGTGASCGLYIGHYFSMSEANQLEASRMLYEDLQLNYVKQYTGDYPWNKPGSYDKVVTVVNNARNFNPNVKFVNCVNNLPNHMEEGGDGPNNKKGEHDETIPGIMDSIANYYFHVCKGYHDRGVTIDILELVNERGYNDGKVTDLYDKAASKFKALINNSSFNTTNVPMPKIMGPATWSAAAPKTFINGWKADRPNAWANCDIVSSHGYQNGTQSSYQSTYDVADGKPFYQSEQTAKLQRDENPGVDVIAEQFPNDAPGYVSNAAIARHMIDFFQGGGNAFFHFLTNNPNGNNPALLGIPWNGSPTAATPYYGFKHLSATHPKNSKRVGRNLSGMGNYKVVCFRMPGEDVIYVHFVNLYNTNEQVTIDFKSYDITAAQHWKTDEFNQFNQELNDTYTTPQSSITINTTPYSVHTLKATIALPSCISSFPYSKSFETGWGDFTQNTDDDFDWTRNSGGTPSNNTGPSAAADGSYYLYTEASNPNNPNKRAILTSQCFDLTGISNPAFEFQYHMYGSDLGTMDVQVSTNGGSSWTTEWSRTGNQGNSWLAASVDLNSYTNASDVLIRFNTINSGWSSDFSIDDVQVKTGGTTQNFVYIDHNSSGDRLKAAGTATNDDIVLTSPTNTGTDVQWELKPISGTSHYYIVNQASGKKLYADPGTEDVQIGDAAWTGDNVRWQLVDIDGTWFHIDHKGTGKRLHASAQSWVVNLTANTWTGNNVRWKSTSVPKSASVITSIDENAIQILTVLPNPAYDMITIKGLTGIQTVQVYTLSGSLVITEKTNGVLNISNLSSGAYILKSNKSKPVIFIKKLK